MLSSLDLTCVILYTDRLQGRGKAKVFLVTVHSVSSVQAACVLGPCPPQKVRDAAGHLEDGVRGRAARAAGQVVRRKALQALPLRARGRQAAQQARQCGRAGVAERAQAPAAQPVDRRLYALRSQQQPRGESLLAYDPTFVPVQSTEDWFRRCCGEDKRQLLVQGRFASKCMPKWAWELQGGGRTSWAMQATKSRA